MQRVLALSVRAGNQFLVKFDKRKFESSATFLHKFCGLNCQRRFINMAAYSVIERGCPNTLEYRMFFKGPDGIISPFHDVPLYHDEANNIMNMVVEVPRWTNAKMEIDTKGEMNPIKQDVKKGKLRFVNNCFPHHGYIWNYGALPQTWEDPNHKDVHTDQNGDNDPIDVCEIGHKVHKTGSIVQVKVLGIMALIDEGETDWKVIAIDVTDPLADDLHDIEDVEKHMPGFIRATNEWFRIYKIPTGKPENQFAFNGEARNKKFALEVIQQTHDQWRSLMQKIEAPISCKNTTVDGSRHKMSFGEAQSFVEKHPMCGPAASIEQEVNKWHYVRL